MKNIIKKIKEHFEYIHNRRIVKRECAKILSSTLPMIGQVSTNGANIFKFILRLVDEANNINGDDLIKMILSEISNLLSTDYKRLVEILTYITNLSPNEIQKILVHSMVETMPNENKTE